MEKYEFIKNIGQGMYGQVFLARHKEENVNYAIKRINFQDINEKDRQNIENEVGAMYNRQKKGLFKMEASYNEEDSENKKDLMDTMKYYKENFEKKNVFNENLCSKTEEAPVEIFEDVSNHVEDLDEEKH